MPSRKGKGVWTPGSVRGSRRAGRRAAGLSRDLTGRRNRPASGHDQGAEPEHPGGERGRIGAPWSGRPGERGDHVPAVYRDLHRPVQAHSRRSGYRQVADRHETSGPRSRVTHSSGGPVTEGLDRIPVRRAERTIQVQPPVRMAVSRFADWESPSGARSSWPGSSPGTAWQRQLPRLDQRARAERVADRAGARPAPPTRRSCRYQVRCRAPDRQAERGEQGRSRKMVTRPRPAARGLEHLDRRGRGSRRRRGEVAGQTGPAVGGGGTPDHARAGQTRSHRLADRRRRTRRPGRRHPRRRVAGGSASRGEADVKAAAYAP